MQGVTKSGVKQMLAYSLGATEVVSAEVGLQDIEMRHICNGTNIIRKLPKCTYPIVAANGFVVNVNYFFCQCCGKLILDNGSTDFI